MSLGVAAISMPHSLKAAILAGRGHHNGFDRLGHTWDGQNPGQFFAVFTVHFPEVVGGLEIEPVSRVDLEEPAEACGGVGGDGTSAGEDFAQAALRNASGLGGRELRDAQGLKELVAQDVAGVGEGGGFGHGRFLS